MSDKQLSPQQRWQQFSAKHLPQLSKRQKIGLGLGLMFVGAIFVLVILPFLLPLADLDQTQDPQTLADQNGRFVKLPQGEIYYTREISQSSSSTEAVIFVHGFGGSVVNWRDTMTILDNTTDQYDLYAVDLLGFGLSQKGLELDVSHPTQADMLAAFMTHYDIEAAHLVGHDMGGNVAMQFAMQYPQQVNTLTLVAPALQYEATLAVPNAVLDTPFLKRWGRVLTRAILPEATAINLQSAAAQDDFITDDLVLDLERGFKTPDWDLSILALARDSQFSALSHDLQSVNAPTLIVWGEADRWIAPATGEQIEADMPNADLITLPDVGHLPMHEAPKRFSETLQAFWQATKLN